MSQTDALDNDMIDEEDEDTLSNRFLTFHLGGEDYGLEIRYVTEIVGVQKITVVPDLPDFVKGVVNLRGQVIPVIDVRLRFKMEARPYDERTCIIVVNLDGAFVGLIVDTVQEVREIPSDKVSAPPRFGHAEKSRYILGMGKVGSEVKILLDVGKLLKEEELAALSDKAL